MGKLLETSYNNLLKLSFIVLNPFKRAVIKTECQVHKFINLHGLQLLKNDHYEAQYAFFTPYMHPINEGAVWADQDFKSSSHFYNPYTSKGLYARKTAMDLGKEYYGKAVELWKIGEPEKSMFYFGAALHILQDMTIPQHANIRLLDNHRQYENFVKKTYKYVKEFHADTGVLIMHSISEYIKLNARVAMKIYKRFRVIANDEDRFYRTAKCTLPMAEKTTAGCMLTFYNEVMASK